MRFVKILLLIYCLISGSQTDAQLQEGSPNFSRTVQWASLKSTVKIIVRRGNRASMGSGVIVGLRGNSLFILTASHVVDSKGKTEIVFFWWDGRSKPAKRSDPKKVIGRYSSGDVALIELQTTGEVPRGLPIYPLGGESLDFDRLPILSVGCDRGKPPFCWTAFTNGQTKRSIITRHEPIGGRSGGPLVTTEGYVIGICSAGGDGEGYFSNLESIHKVCDDANASWLYGGNQSIPYSPTIPQCSPFGAT